MWLNKAMPYLLLARHGESEYNSKNLWTGVTDCPLTDKGRGQAALMAGAIKDLKPDVAFTSMLSRAQDTLQIILQDNHWDEIPTYFNKSLNERDYGEYTGMNKLEVEKQVGHEKFIKIRRGWDEPVPGGETLKMVYQRMMLYFNDHIIPEIKSGRSVLVVAHGNSLRALIKYLDTLNDAEIEDVEMPLVEILVYNYEMRIAAKQVRQFEAKLPYVTVNTSYIKE
jgi:2,3-bisphosphoglycerate-dependent phosphoglycerate mutase